MLHVILQMLCLQLTSNYMIISQTKIISQVKQNSVNICDKFIETLKYEWP